MDHDASINVKKSLFLIAIFFFLPLPLFFLEKIKIKFWKNFQNILHYMFVFALTCISKRKNVKNSIYRFDTFLSNNQIYFVYVLIQLFVVLTDWWI